MNFALVVQYATLSSLLIGGLGVAVAAEQAVTHLISSTQDRVLQTSASAGIRDAGQQ
jgi:hypothetical protein